MKKRLVCRLPRAAPLQKRQSFFKSSNTKHQRGKAMDESGYYGGEFVDTDLNALADADEFYFDESGFFLTRTQKESQKWVRPYCSSIGSGHIDAQLQAPAPPCMNRNSRNIARLVNDGRTQSPFKAVLIMKMSRQVPAIRGSWKGWPGRRAKRLKSRCGILTCSGSGKRRRARHGAWLPRERCVGHEANVQGRVGARFTVRTG